MSGNMWPLRNKPTPPNPYAWLALPLMKGDLLAQEGMDLATVSDASVADIHGRMDLIFTAFENRVCEGRHLDPELLDELDALGSRLQAGEVCTLDQCLPLIIKVGQRYGLYECRAIDVTDPCSPA